MTFSKHQTLSAVLYFIAALSVDRFISTQARPLISSNKFAVISSSIIWISAILLSVPTLFSYKLYEFQETYDLEYGPNTDFKTVADGFIMMQMNQNQSQNPDMNNNMNKGPMNREDMGDFIYNYCENLYKE